MFPIRITTLMTEEVYKRFSWAILDEKDLYYT